METAYQVVATQIILPIVDAVIEPTFSNTLGVYLPVKITFFN